MKMESDLCWHCKDLREQKSMELTDAHDRFIRDACQANQWARMERNNLKVPELTDEKRKELIQNQDAERKRMRAEDAKLGIPRVNSRY